jgi:type IV pilus assembly protein PilO
MKDLIERVYGFSKVQRIAMWVGSVLIIPIIFYQLTLKANLKSKAGLIEKIESYEEERSKLNQMVRKLPLIERTVKDLESKLNSVVAELPDQKEIPSLLSSISTLAKSAGLDISLFRPQNELKREFYAEVPVAVKVEGTFHQVVTFFDEIARLSRIVNVSEIAMSEPKQIADSSESRVSTACNITTFRYLGDEKKQSDKPKK